MRRIKENQEALRKELTNNAVEALTELFEYYKILGSREALDADTWDKIHNIEMMFIYLEGKATIVRSMEIR